MADLEAEKAMAAARAVEEVRDGMLVGLGTGTTTAYAIRDLAARVRQGLRIDATATSRATEVLATSRGLTITPFEAISRVDLTIDGADEIDPKLRAIKGGGGALLRERIVSAASDRTLIVVDSSKPVPRLGRFKLPVEVLPFAAAFVEHNLKALNGQLARRVQADGRPFLTDQGGYIYDLALGQIDDPDALALWLDAVPGITAHGLFLSEIDCVIVAEGDTTRMFARCVGVDAP
jgi:ribose 5-phosphate isomerase A